MKEENVYIIINGKKKKVNSKRLYRFTGDLGWRLLGKNNEKIKHTK